MTIRWYGLVAPEEAPTGDRRMLAKDMLTYRQFPLYAAWQEVSGSGHSGSVVVGSWDRQFQGIGGIWATGEFLDPTIIPQVSRAVYLLEKKLVGPSIDLDPDFAYEVVPHPDRPEEFAMKVTRGNIHGVTFVMGPAFPQVHITVDTMAEMDVLTASGVSATFAASGVNSSSWTKFPLAPRETTFSADTAIDNIAAWSGGDAQKFASAFLWKDPGGNPLNRETYRLPIVDVLNGKPYLIPRAVFSAGVIMSGGHGGLYDTLSEQDRVKVQEVITDIYDMLRDEYADPRVVAPWQRGGRQGATSEVDEPTRVASADVLNHWTSGMPAEKLREAMEYANSCFPKVEVPVISEELDAYINSRVASLILHRDEDCATGAVGGVDPALTAATGVLKPSAQMFADPGLRQITPLHVGEDGRVFGHLATWKQCHMGVGNKCIIAPHTKTNYRWFKTGSVLTDDGKTVRIGKITIGTGHADKRFGIVPATEHYDDTGTCVAVVNAGEDSFGVWVSGALVTGVSEDRVAELRRSPLSGDWRRVDGNLELVAALAVNSPGFPVLDEDGDGAYSLVAAGVVGEQGGQDGVGLPEPGPQVQTRFAEVDEFLRAERADRIGRAFQDLLPQEGCGCGV